ncbi:MAG TPA: hypothetical protein VMT69_06145 [Kineosporiaceae bacterium]|nr:hypothetical protein [Kineosporiaceae bacterium]
MDPLLRGNKERQPGAPGLMAADVAWPLLVVALTAARSAGLSDPLASRLVSARRRA